MTKNKTPGNGTVKKSAIGFRGTEEFRRDLQRAAIDRGIKVQTLLEEAVALYLKKTPARLRNPA